MHTEISASQPGHADRQDHTASATARVDEPAAPPVLVDVDVLAGWLGVPRPTPPQGAGHRSTRRSEAFAGEDDELGRGQIVLLDVRWTPTGGGDHDTYVRGHLPGAVYVALESQLAGHAGPQQGRHPLPEPARFAEAVRMWGIEDGDTVVVYDDVSGASAARAWWLLRHAGITTSLLLDGGLSRWRAAGLPLQAGEVIPAPGSAHTSWGRMPVVDSAGAEAVASGGLLLDARSAQRYAGRDEPLDPVAGHIPGAVNVPADQLLDADGLLLPPAQLRERFDAQGMREDLPVAASCGSGVTACHTVLALAAAGRHGVALYPGSWSAWCQNPDNPVATGPEPAGS
ncbi:sulfurtransferase [uncultured Micrococcus sp.]|uniref:sulfurtransferase n=1 Tax=uncultured Micrococcus sp. TaxID=114051 RepID=UPI00259433EB|nr:sulfurtransferase [uncultured Micrococcus sp.]